MSRLSPAHKWNWRGDVCTTNLGLYHRAITDERDLACLKPESKVQCSLLLL
jgi:hypothetical protein